MQFSIAISFVAGLVSFLSPCVLPIIPGFLSYLAGSATKQGDDKPAQKDIFLSSIFFVLGFSVVFAALGVLLNTALERVAYDVQLWLSRIGGVVVMFFGLYLTHLIRIPFLEQTHQVRVTKRFSSRYVTSFVFGSAFAVGWTPCVGAVLGGILGLAASEPGSAFFLLLSYSLGLGLPFLLIGLFTGRASAYIARYAAALDKISIAFGIVLIALGVLIFTQKLSIIANFELLNRFLLR